MSGSVITRLMRMGRWTADARGRLQGAALDLFAERGYEQTTVADIAERAGVTERTFYRHYADKREVLFAGSKDLQAAVVASIAAAPEGESPISVACEALTAGGSNFIRDFSVKRAVAIAANPSLQERELLKLATLGAAVAEALRARGVPAASAAVAAETSMTVFKLAFERWVTDAADPAFRDCADAVLAELRADLTR